MSNKYNRDIRRAALIQETASITGVSIRQVRRVLDSQQKNEIVASVYMSLLEGACDLINEVKKLVPFDAAPVRGIVSNRSTNSTRPK